MGYWVLGSGFWVQGSRFRVQGSGFRVQGSGFRVQGSGLGLHRGGRRLRDASRRDCLLNRVVQEGALRELRGTPKRDRLDQSGHGHFGARCGEHGGAKVAVSTLGEGGGQRGLGVEDVDDAEGRRLRAALHLLGVEGLGCGV